MGILQNENAQGILLEMYDRIAYTLFLWTRFSYLEALLRRLKSLNKIELKKYGIRECGEV
jgi:hypothetical protein